VIIDGNTVYENGEFVKVKKEEILEAIHIALSKPRDEDEIERHLLRKEVFPVVENFYKNYIVNTSEKHSFYKNSSTK
jgi:hypothetical protein